MTTGVLRTESAWSFVRDKGRIPWKANTIVWGIKKECRCIRIDVISNAVIGELKCAQKIEILPAVAART